jgi:hypothetical protein
VTGVEGKPLEGKLVLGVSPFGNSMFFELLEPWLTFSEDLQA